MARAVRWKLRPGLGIAQALDACTHEIAVFAADAWPAVRRRVVGMRRYPVDAGRDEKIQPGVPVAVIQELGLPVEELFDVLFQRTRRSQVRFKIGPGRGHNRPTSRHFPLPPCIRTKRETSRASAFR